MIKLVNLQEREDYNYGIEDAPSPFDGNDSHFLDDISLGTYFTNQPMSKEENLPQYDMSELPSSLEITSKDFIDDISLGVLGQIACGLPATDAPVCIFQAVEASLPHTLQPSQLDPSPAAKPEPAPPISNKAAKDQSPEKIRYQKQPLKRARPICELKARTHLGLNIRSNSLPLRKPVAIDALSRSPASSLPSTLSVDSISKIKGTPQRVESRLMQPTLSSRNKINPIPKSRLNRENSVHKDTNFCPFESNLANKRVCRKNVNH